MHGNHGRERANVEIIALVAIGIEAELFLLIVAQTNAQPVRVARALRHLVGHRMIELTLVIHLHIDELAHVSHPARSAAGRCHGRGRAAGG